MDAGPLPWIFFNAFILAMLALDLGVFHRKAHVVRTREALTWSGVWIALALAFNVLIYVESGQEAALQFTAGYLIEKSLSVDNVFIFLMIFHHFETPPRSQHRVLFWGIMGALVLRAIFIFAGVELLHRFHWILYLFGGFLLLTGVRLAFRREVPKDFEQTATARFVRKILPFPIAEDVQEGFFVRREGRLHATRLLLALLMIELTDVIFAVDSIPAVLAVTPDPFIVYTSNVFSLLGLRSLYFALAGLHEKFRFLKYGLAAILVFVGCKMLTKEVFTISTWASLAVVSAILLVSIGVSMLWPFPYRNSRSPRKKAA